MTINYFTFNPINPPPAMVLLQQLNAPCPYYLNDDRKNTVLTLGISLILVVTLIAFDPTCVLGPKIAIIGTVVFLVLFSHIVLLPKLLPAAFDALQWTFGKYLAFTAWQLALCGPAIAIVKHALHLHHESIGLGESILATYPRIVSFGIIPVGVGTMILRTYALKENLRNAIRANQELERIRTLKEDKKEEVTEDTQTHRITISSDTRETLTLNLPDLLYVEANDNYSTIVWKNGNGVEKKILRINLKNMETQLNNSFALRCHRSFIVNIYAIGHISGNTNGYKLSIRDTDFSVPVSRSKGKEVLGKLRQLRDMIELY